MSELRSGPVAQAIRRHRLIIVLRRIEPQDKLLALVEELADSGARAFEITFDAPSAADDIAAVRARLAGRSDGPFIVGAGTITRRDQLDAARASGADFGVAPVVDLELVRAATGAGFPFVPGGMTPSEMSSAWAAGATFVKLFPASVAGPQLHPRAARSVSRDRGHPHRRHRREQRPVVPGLRRGGSGRGQRGGAHDARGAARVRRARSPSSLSLVYRFRGRAALQRQDHPRHRLDRYRGRGRSGAGRRRCHVFVASRTADHVDNLVESLAVRAAGQAADLTQEDAVESVVAACVARFGRLDGVYNVAGISGRRFGDGPLHEMTLDGWQTVLANNVTSQMLVCRAAIRQMLEPGSGRQRPARGDPEHVERARSASVVRSSSRPTPMPLPRARSSPCRVPLRRTTRPTPSASTSSRPRSWQRR